VAKGTGSLWLALPLGLVGGAVAGAALQWTLFRHFARREHLDQVMLTFALILLAEELRWAIAGNDFHAVPIPSFLDFPVPVTAGFSYSAYRFAVIGVCLLLAALMFVWLERTRMGAVVRAAAEAPEIVDVLGIDARRVHMTVFAAGTALAVVAGVLAAPLTSVYPGMGDGLLIISFVVVVIGGLGSVSGAFWSALLIGIVDTMGKAYGPAFQGAGALGTLIAALAGSSVYILMIAVLLWRPTGLMGQRA
jgi:branched-chain amino acid transport system permease protein